MVGGCVAADGGGGGQLNIAMAKNAVAATVLGGDLLRVLPAGGAADKFGEVALVAADFKVHLFVVTVDLPGATQYFFAVDFFSFAQGVVEFGNVHVDAVVNHVDGLLAIGTDFGAVFEDDAAVVGPALAVVQACLRGGKLRRGLFQKNDFAIGNGAQRQGVIVSFMGLQVHTVVPHEVVAYGESPLGSAGATNQTRGRGLHGRFQDGVVGGVKRELLWRYKEGRADDHRNISMVWEDDCDNDAGSGPQSRKGIASNGNAVNRT